MSDSTKNIKKNINATIYQTLYEMVQQRGYISPFPDTNNSQIDEQVILADKPDGSNICAFLEVQKNFNKDEFQNTIGKMNLLNVNHAIVVYEKVTFAVKSLVTDVRNIDYRIEIFHISEVKFNITKHSLACLHSKVEDAKTLELLKKYSPEQFPKIKSTDPMARFYGFRPGDIIKVVRKNGFVMYRKTIK